MTVAVRVIPCLDVDAGRVVKGVNFVDLRDAGDPVEMAKVYDAEGADELVFLDITASSDQRDTIYDVVIRNGRVLDGAGNPWILADVAIAHGRFVKIGHIPARGRTEIDATGKYVSPGLIDMMDQSGSTLRNSGLAENKLRQGVTTAIGGEGGTPVRLSPDEAERAQLELWLNPHGFLRAARMPGADPTGTPVPARGYPFRNTLTD